MNKVLKIVIFLLSLVGVLCIWCLLNYISNGNVTGQGLGDSLIMYVGLITLMFSIWNVISKF